jgi:hypothetical protein
MKSSDTLQACSRRTTLRALGSSIAVVAGVGTNKVSAQPSLDIAHSTGATTRTSTDTEAFDRAISHKLNIVAADGEPFEFGPDRRFRVINKNTGREVQLQPVDGTDPVLADRFRPEPDGTPDQLGIASSELTAIGLPNSESTSTKIEVNASGDTDPFPEGVFGRFEVRLEDINGNTLGSTGERIIASGYQYDVEITNDTVSITRDSGVDAEWTTEFAVATDEVFPALSPEATVPVDHDDGDDTFEIDLTELNAAGATYNGELLIATPDADPDSIRDFGDQSQIIALLDVGSVTLEHDNSPDDENKTHESGVSDNVFEAVDSDGDGDLSRVEVRDTVEGFTQNGEVNGVSIDRPDVRDLIEYHIRN